MNKQNLFTGISLKTLFDVKGSDLEYGVIEQEIDGEFEYYDFVNERGSVCMDGETCMILKVDENSVTLLSNNEEYGDNYFKLSHAEYDVATFN